MGFPWKKQPFPFGSEAQAGQSLMDFGSASRAKALKASGFCPTEQPMADRKQS